MSVSELRDCVNREVGVGSHSLSHSSPVSNKPYCFFCGLKVSVSELRDCVNREWAWALIPCPILPPSLISPMGFLWT